MNNLSQRVFTGIVLMALTIIAVFSGTYTFLLFILGINFLGLLEFYRLFHAAGIPIRKDAGLILGSILLLSSALFITSFSDWKILLINIPIGFLIFFSELFLRSEKPFLKLAFTFLGIIYITIPLVFLAFIPFTMPGIKSYHPQIVFGFFLLVWTSDIGAYAVGSAIGKHPLFKRISPGKTWEGSAGGTCFTLITAFVISHYNHDLSLSEWLTIAIIVVFIGTSGDLIKSMLKRSLHVKDSGKILPGHGGILDRCDALLSSALFVYCYLILFTSN